MRSHPTATGLCYMLLAAVAAQRYGAANRTVMIWLYETKGSEATWSGWYDALAAHKENVTAISPCSLLLGKDGTFGSQLSPDAMQVVEKWTSKIKNGIGLQAVPLIAGNPTGVHKLLRNSSARTAFIDAAVQYAKDHDLNGFNIDAELPGNSSDGVLWV